QALATYCRAYLPDPAHEPARRRLSAAAKDKRTLDVAKQLATELRRWLKVMNMDLLKATGSAMIAAQTKLAEVRGWLTVLDDLSPTA
ncbi:MAG: hypothetical protein H7338_06660, partial [Candidatus Sericytochromatia bacterium]|nr:hypothetical protein [Candidatus Sericytochromatia bacterium]